MTSRLTICHASESQRLAAYRNVHDVWSGGLPMEEHVARRLKSPQHNRAGWLVGCLGDEVVSSLATYPLSFRIRGQVNFGIAIGSVHTVARHRGRGFAPRLIRYAEQLFAQNSRAAVSLLYSDIDPAYYERLGYLRCPAWEGWTDVGAGSVPPNDEGDRLVPARLPEAIAGLQRLYAGYHGTRAVSIDRDRGYWRHLLEKRPADRFLLLETSESKTAGYVRVGSDGKAGRIVDYALASTQQDLAERLYRALIHWANSDSLVRVGGWLPDCRAARSCFALQPRTREITMLKPLLAGLALDEALLASANQFCEIDHV